MAIMMCGAVDWTLDKFAEDMRSVKALPMKRGVHSAKNLTEGQKFCQYIKTQAKFFREENSDNGVYVTGTYDYIGDAFVSYLKRSIFSDCYKDTYNQRPHFAFEYVAMLCELPVFGEIGFCGDGYREMLEEAITRARDTRAELIRRY